MSNYKNHDEFKAGIVVMVASVDAAWKQLSNLAVESVEHYSKTGDMNWIVSLYTALVDMEGGEKMVRAYEKLLKQCTNVKLKGDPDNLESPITAEHKGSVPSDAPTILANVKQEGIRKWGNVKGSRSASTMKRLGNDYVTPSRSKGDKDGNGTVVSGTATQKALASCEDAEKKAKAIEAAEKAAQAVLDGKEPPLMTSEVHLDAACSKVVQEIIGNLQALQDTDKRDAAINALNHANNSLTSQLAAVHRALLAQTQSEAA